MSSPTRWRRWTLPAPDVKPQFGAQSPESAGREVVGSTAVEPRLTPVPEVVGNYEAYFGGTPSKLTLVRHNQVGVNRFGQAAAEFPYLFVNYAAWREMPFDLARAHWYRSRDEALAAVGGAPCPKPPKPKPEVNATCARFPGGVGVELRQEGKSRWLMWVTRNGKRQRRRDFASPFLEHARRTAEHWYGVPVGGWEEPE